MDTTKIMERLKALADNPDRLEDEEKRLDEMTSGLCDCMDQLASQVVEKVVLKAILVHFALVAKERGMSVADTHLAIIDGLQAYAASSLGETVRAIARMSYPMGEELHLTYKDTALKGCVSVVEQAFTRGARDGKNWMKKHGGENE